MIDAVSFDADGLVPVITADAASGDVLMFAWMNRAALEETVASGRAVYYSRSRQRLWRKGETSGQTQSVVELRLDCDGDVLLMRVEQDGQVACHTGRRSCFYRRLDGDGRWVTCEPVLIDPDTLYGRTDD